MFPSSAGLGSLTTQPQYLPSDSRLARYAAPYYRPIIFALTSLILFFTAIKSHDAPPFLQWGFIISLIIYAGVFKWRMGMPQKVAGIFYQPHIQFLRGQATILVITLMILLLASQGYYHHMLWLLYTLATLLISEHNKTAAMLFTLAEVAFFYVLASYIGWSIYNQSWTNLLAFWQDNHSMGEHILGIWLVTFVFHYLVRNIHGRNKAFDQQQQWLNFLAEHLAHNEDPQAQRRTLIEYVAQLTGGEVLLWRPRLRDNHLVDQHNNLVSEEINIAAHQPVPTFWLPKIPPNNPHNSCLYLPGPPVRPNALAQLVIPIRQLEKPYNLLGVLDIAYPNRCPDQFQLATTCSIMLKLIDYARLILINSQQKEQTRLLWDLSIKLHQQLNIPALVEQVVSDLVDELGFDFATISLVDDHENLIRGVGERRAPWAGQSIHPLSGKDIQSRVVREGITHVNEGKYEACLDGKIWNEHMHWRFSRVWTHVPDPAANSPYPALGTLEAGFDHSNRKIIPPDQIRLIQQYARHVGLALANAEAHQRTQELAHAMMRLQSISRKMQRAAAQYEPHQMIKLIGQSAEKLLHTDIAMLYTYDEETATIDLVYQTRQAIQGRGALHFNFQGGVLEHLQQQRKSYYSPNARRDPMLVKIKANGRLSHKDRTFTQRQNIKSFAGVPLIGKQDNILGFLCINYRRRRHFYPELRQIIELFAAQATVALEETYQHRLSRRVLVVRERNQLAAELHHMLSQELFGLKSFASAASTYAQSGDWDKAMTNLHNVTSHASWSLQSVRELLNYLDERHNGQIDFIKDMEDYIQHIKPFYPQANIHFKPRAQGKAPKQVQFCLLRIAREALNNALRHAKCHAIQIGYHAAGSGHVHLTVQDDGVGFDVVRAPQKNHYGLGTIRYFAQEINGKLQINSQEGAGTCVQVQVSPPTNGA